MLNEFVTISSYLHNWFIAMLALQGFLVFLPSLGFVAAHKHPQSAQEREVQRALQAAAYHVIIPVERNAVLFFTNSTIVCPSRRVFHSVKETSLFTTVQPPEHPRGTSGNILRSTTPFLSRCKQCWQFPKDGANLYGMHADFRNSYPEQHMYSGPWGHWGSILSHRGPSY